MTRSVEHPDGTSATAPHDLLIHCPYRAMRVRGGHNPMPHLCLGCSLKHPILQEDRFVARPFPFLSLFNLPMFPLPPSSPLSGDFFALLTTVHALLCDGLPIVLYGGVSGCRFLLPTRAGGWGVVLVGTGDAQG